MEGGLRHLQDCLHRLLAEVDQTVAEHEAQLELGLEAPGLSDPNKLTKQELATLQKYVTPLVQGRRFFKSWLEGELSSGSFTSMKTNLRDDELPIQKFRELVDFPSFYAMGLERLDGVVAYEQVESYEVFASNQKQWAREFKAEVVKSLNKYTAGAKAYISAHRTSAKKLETASPHTGEKGRKRRRARRQHCRRPRRGFAARGLQYSRRLPSLELSQLAQHSNLRRPSKRRRGARWNTIVPSL